MASDNRYSFHYSSRDTSRDGVSSEFAEGLVARITGLEDNVGKAMKFRPSPENSQAADVLRECSQSITNVLKGVTLDAEHEQVKPGL